MPNADFERVSDGYAVVGAGASPASEHGHSRVLGCTLFAGRTCENHRRFQLLQILAAAERFNALTLGLGGNDIPDAGQFFLEELLYAKGTRPAEREATNDSFPTGGVIVPR
jgi:hypothetical protein